MSSENRECENREWNFSLKVGMLGRNLWEGCVGVAVDVIIMH